MATSASRSDSGELRLDDGRTFVGERIGAPGSAAGEVVFCTAMTGYIQALTDPSYRGQILVLTYPHVGGYGVPLPRASGSLDGPYESDRIQVQALITQSPIEHYSHHTAARSLADWLASEGVPALANVDTRALTIHLRARGTMRGTLHAGGDAARELDMTDLGQLVAPRALTRHDGGPCTVLVVDMGAKDNLIRSFLSRGVSVVRAPFTSDIGAIAREVDGVVLGSGPGDPKSFGPLIAATRALLGSYRKPIFGVCLGSQILALAAGGDTQKLPYGHRGVNQPVRDVQTGRCYVTSQNHGYAVVGSSLPAGWQASFVNVNDGTNEGVRSLERPHFGVQFHPEAKPGPEDATFLFDDMVRLIHSMRTP